MGNGKKITGVSDFVMLDEITEDAFFNNISSRLSNDEIYTYLGNVVISINPYKTLSIYEKDTMDKYKAKHTIFEAPPHVFALTDAAYRDMTEYKRDQCIIITGESGAGKTEASKYILQYIAHVSHASEEVTKINNILLQSNPILEAFGNSKTLRNDNSSRFGKYMEIQFDLNGDPIGGRIFNYLLEKSRVVSPAINERSFHSFYQLIKSRRGAKFGLSSDADKYRYLKKSECYSISDVNDAKDFIEVESAMRSVGLDETEIDGVYQIVAAILHLGNVDFEKADESAKVKKSESFSQFCKLIGVNEGNVEKALVERTVATREETVKALQDVDKAEYARDALAKAMYERLFNWLVQRINKTLAVRVLTNSFKDRTVVGILDIYGFEIFDNNSFEQFCINYCNEKLQQLFIELTLMQEQEEYRSEGIQWTPVEFFNNAAILELIEHNTNGIIAVLDEQALVPGNPTDRDFLTKMETKFKTSKYFSSDGKSSHATQFCLTHYAGDVQYNVDGFLEKNLDTLFKDLKGMMYSSSNNFIQQMFPDGANTEQVAKRPITNAMNFKNSLNELKINLKTKNPNYIRCIKPNNTKKAITCDETLVRHQIRYLGLIENLKVKRAGFAFRERFSKFVSRYAVLASEIWPGYLKMDQKECAGLIMKAAGISDKEFQLGKTKIFVRMPQKIFELEKKRETILPEMALRIQRVYRGYRSRLLSSKIKAAMTIIRAYRNFNYKRYFDKLAKGLKNDYKTVAWPVPPKKLPAIDTQLYKTFKKWKAQKLLEKYDEEGRKLLSQSIIAREIFKDYKNTMKFQSCVECHYLDAESNPKRKAFRTFVVKLNKRVPDEPIIFSDFVKKVSRAGAIHLRGVVLTTKTFFILTENLTGICKDIGYPIAHLDTVMMTQHTDSMVALKFDQFQNDILLDFVSLQHLHEFVILLAQSWMRLQTQDEWVLPKIMFNNKHSVSTAAGTKAWLCLPDMSTKEVAFCKLGNKAVHVPVME